MGGSASVICEEIHPLELERRDHFIKKVIDEFAIYDGYIADEDTVSYQSYSDINKFLSPEKKVMDDLWPEALKLRRSLTLTSRVTAIPLIELEPALDAAFRSQKTPLILDSSHDDKVCTFLSYQTDVITFNAKSMVIAGSKALAKNLEELRRHLVMAMKHGKTLHIRLGTSAPDFRSTFVDEYAKNKITDPSCYGQIDTPLKGSWERIYAKTGLNIEELEDDAKERGEELDLESYRMYGHVHGMVPDLADEKAFFPSITLRKCGIGLLAGQDYWVPKLYRDDDIKPHRNFAIAKPGFRVIISSQMKLDDAAEHLFDFKIDKGDNEHGGDGYGASLPPMHFFSVIDVLSEREEEEEKDEDEEDDEEKGKKVNDDGRSVGEEGEWISMKKSNTT